MNGEAALEGTLLDGVGVLVSGAGRGLVVGGVVDANVKEAFVKGDGDA